MDESVTVSVLARMPTGSGMTGSSAGLATRWRSFLLQTRHLYLVEIVEHSFHLLVRDYFQQEGMARKPFFAFDDSGSTSIKEEYEKAELDLVTHVCIKVLFADSSRPAPFSALQIL